MMRIEANCFIKMINQSTRTQRIIRISISSLAQNDDSLFVMRKNADATRMYMLLWRVHSRNVRIHRIQTYVCIYMYVCMYYVCMYVCMYMYNSILVH